MLDRFGINTKNLDLEKLKSEYDTLVTKKKELEMEYKNVQKEACRVKKEIENVEKYLGVENSLENSKTKEFHKENLD